MPPIPPDDLHSRMSVVEDRVTRIGAETDGLMADFSRRADRTEQDAIFALRLADEVKRLTEGIGELKQVFSTRMSAYEKDVADLKAKVDILMSFQKIVCWLGGAAFVLLVAVAGAYFNAFFNIHFVRVK